MIIHDMFDEIAHASEDPKTISVTWLKVMPGQLDSEIYRLHQFTTCTVSFEHFFCRNLLHRVRRGHIPMDRWYTVIDKWRSGETNSKTDDVDIMNTNRKENSLDTKPLSPR